jgi:glucose-6-phosphate 1-dehydrogenase
MEPPARFIADRVQDDKAKVLRSLRRVPEERLKDHIVIGQYGPGRIREQQVPGYREEVGVARNSTTPTYAALKLFIDNWRWQGVPFYLRSGKRLAKRKTEISIHFKEVPFSMFPDSISGPIEPNTIVLKIQPDEGMSLIFQTKQPGTKVCLNPVQMTYSYPRGLLLDAYEWVLLDCMLGDHMLFMREDSVELAWSTLTPLLDAIGPAGKVPLSSYPAGSEGPEAARHLMEKDRRAWRPL